MSFRYSVNTNALRKLPISEIVALSTRLGLDGIEWGLPAWDQAGAAIAEMAQRTRDAGLAVAGYINGPKLWQTDDLRRWAELVARNGGTSLRVAHPWIAWNYAESLHQRDSWHDIFRLAHDAIPAAVELSRTTGVRFLLELHAGALTASALAAAKLLDGVDPACLGVIYDPANTVIEGGMRPRSEVEILGTYLAYVHAKNVIFLPTGRDHRQPLPRAAWEHRVAHPSCGILDWLEVCFALKAGGFSGWISSEEYFPSGDDQEAQLRDGVAFLRACAAHAPASPCGPFTSFNS